MGLTGGAVIAGFVERPAERPFPGPRKLGIEQWADLAADALADAGIAWSEVDGICTGAEILESPRFVPATLAEYCGWSVNFAERCDLGGASNVGMVWRAAAAVELGLAEVVVCAVSGQPRPPSPVSEANPAFWFGASASEWGSPQAEFEIPFANLGQNGGFAQYATAYHAAFGWNERARAKVVVDQRISAQDNPDAIFYGSPTTIDEVLGSRMIADPLRLMEIVMPVAGGAAVVVTTPERCERHRGVKVIGCGEHLTHKTPTYAPDLTETPVGPAARRAFAMAGLHPSEMDMVQLYDCYTITALLTLEGSGFCGKGEAMDFVEAHDLTWRGDFPMNTNGGQLGFGQAGLAGGMGHIVEAVRQIQGRAGQRQLARHDRAYVSGTGGVMSEQSALVLEGM